MQDVSWYQIRLGLGSGLSTNRHAHLPLWHLHTLVVWYGRLCWYVLEEPQRNLKERRLTMRQRLRPLHSSRQRSRQMPAALQRKSILEQLRSPKFIPTRRNLQVAKVRFGVVLGHLAYMFAALVANFVVGSEILIGGAGVITGMTGISEYAAIWLLPLVVVAYGS